MLHKLLSAAFVCTIVVTGTVTGASSASASLACSATRVKINGSYWSSGHSHVTGSHYVHSISGNVWTWFSDNYGGRDGNTADTYYGKIAC